MKNRNDAHRLSMLERENTELRRENEDLGRENEKLKHENAKLKNQVDFLLLHPTLAQGLKGENLIAKLTGGVRTHYGVSHDVITKRGVRLEVKRSKVTEQSTTKTKRWNWQSLLGSAGNKEYDYLVLLGEKDPDHEKQYPADIPLVIFLIPLSDVKNKLSGVKKKQIAMSTNFETARSHKDLVQRYLVREVETLEKL